jgi:hypothetical protein
MSIAGLGPVHLKDSTHIHPHSATTPISNTSACNKDVDDDNLHKKKEMNESSKVPSSSTANKATFLASADALENVNVSGFISFYSDCPKA